MEQVSGASVHSQWRLLRTPVRVVGRTLQRRVFWHKIQNIILSHARWDARFVAVSLGEILTLASSACSSHVAGRRWRLLVAGISSCLFHLDVAMQLLQDYLICITVDDEDALLLGVVLLTAFEDSVGNARAVWMRKSTGWNIWKIFVNEWKYLPRWGSVTVTELFEPVCRVASLCTSTLAGLKSSVRSSWASKVGWGTGKS